MKQVLSLCAALCLLAGVSYAATLVDDFEGYQLGQVGAVASPPWTAIAGGTDSEIAAEEDGNQFLTIGYPSGNQGVYIPIDPVDNTSVATLFVRVYAVTSSQDTSFGLSDVASPTSVNWGNYEVQLVAGNGPDENSMWFRARNGASVQDMMLFNVGEWYNVWAVIDQATDTYDVYATTGTDSATPADKLNASPLAFRNGTTDDLVGFMVLTNWRSKNIRFDDVYMMVGQDLTNPTLNLTGAHDPYPASRQEGIELNQTLSWNTGLDPEDLESVNSDITHHYLSLIAGEPNFANPLTTTALIPATGARDSYTPGNLLPDRTYYWRVDEVLNGQTSDPNFMITGPVWRFNTIMSAPNVTASPAIARVFEGDDAEFVVAYTSYSEATALWFIYVDGENDIPLTDEDGVVLNPAKYAVENNKHTQTKLTVKDAVVADEGYYYCVLINPEELEDESVPAALAVKRLRAHWTLDGLVGGQYADETGNHPADPNGTPQFIDGANPAVTAQAVVIDQVNGFATAGTWNPSEYSNQFTISLWAKWYGQTTPTTWQGLISKEVSYGVDTMMWQLEVNQGAPYGVALKNGMETGNLTTPVLPIDAWEHVVLTWNGTAATIYRNGVQAASGNWQPGSMTDAPVNIGISAFSPTINLMFNGALDDIRIYNYAVDNYAAADLYHDVTGLGVCIETDNYVAAYDFNGNCKIDLGDFAIMAAQWLQCGRYPVDSCED